MNVTDFDSKLPEGDLLRALFNRQRELMRKYHFIEQANIEGAIPHGLNHEDPHASGLDIQTKQAQQRLKDFFWRITEELGEAANTLKNKPWKITHMVTDEVHFREELIDALHFFIEMMILAGFDEESMVVCYLNKAEVNSFRQRSK